MECVSAVRTDSIVEADLAAATRLGAPGTPTVLVNGEMYLGNPFRFADIVERHLATTPLEGPS